jgi:hypothetical protein
MEDRTSGDGVGGREFSRAALLHTLAIFAVDPPNADAIRHVLQQDGAFSTTVEVRRHFPVLTSNAAALECARIIARWQPMSPSKTGRVHPAEPLPRHRKPAPR